MQACQRGDAHAELPGADFDDARSLAAEFAGAHRVFALTIFCERDWPETGLTAAANNDALSRDSNGRPCA